MALREDCELRVQTQQNRYCVCPYEDGGGLATGELGDLPHRFWEQYHVRFLKKAIAG